MRVTVRLGEPYRRQAGVREIELEMPGEATVADLLAAIETRYEALLEGDVPPTVLLDDQIVDLAAPLRDGSEATLVWALSGG
ncbi:MAG TPA: MoaD/ThiS family protein [Anaerolineales bacterium]|nr:MoaD/ThiS family protein [Anaerolineales bacterium]